MNSEEVVEARHRAELMEQSQKGTDRSDEIERAKQILRRDSDRAKKREIQEIHDKFRNKELEYNRKISELEDKITALKQSAHREKVNISLSSILPNYLIMI